MRPLHPCNSSVSLGRPLDGSQAFFFFCCLPVSLSRFLARSLYLLLSRVVGISLACSPCGSRPLARWIHSFALSLARSISRFFALSLSRFLSFSLSRFLVVSLSRSLACSLSRPLTVLLSRWCVPSSARALALCRVFALKRGLLCADPCLKARCFEMICSKIYLDITKTKLLLLLLRPYNFHDLSANFILFMYT